MSANGWLLIEVEALCDILSSHLSQPEINGQFSKIDWDAVAKKYNSHFAGVLHKRGSPFEDMTKMLNKDVYACGRTAIAIRRHTVLLRNGLRAITGFAIAQDCRCRRPKGARNL
ncbi:hypothetical protein SBOR_1779 [Sclerotinia borealis F-4128]|uniref:Myb/SANT-like domain-containing protein n=1 Tax=Sclerotinia borealis (strain F-4128) TaxID=1432307 RepID=W9CTF7_SCLBF|nr:hypothetical protein SBOR_1779 [Sclerotinia borealis F-4128]